MKIISTLRERASVYPKAQFWDKGLSVISGMIDELEAMEGV
jgi:hypothetical protein